MFDLGTGALFSLLLTNRLMERADTLYMSGGAINACLPPIRAPGTPDNPNQASVGTLLGGRHAINSELGVCAFFLVATLRP